MCHELVLDEPSCLCLLVLRSRPLLDRDRDTRFGQFVRWLGRGGSASAQGHARCRRKLRGTDRWSGIPLRAARVRWQDACRPHRWRRRSSRAEVPGARRGDPVSQGPRTTDRPSSDGGDGHLERRDRELRGDLASRRRAMADLYGSVTTAPADIRLQREPATLVTVMWTVARRLEARGPARTGAGREQPLYRRRSRLR